MSPPSPVPIEAWQGDHGSGEEEGMGNRRGWPSALLRRLAVAVAVVALLAPIPSPAAGDEMEEARALVEEAKIAFERVASEETFAPDFRDLARRARGIFIAPEIVRVALVFGGSGGSGLVVVRDEKSGGWAGPAFYGMGGASVGFQAGVDSSAIVLLAMTERGVTALLSPSAKLGANASVAFGPVGGGVSASTINLSADIVAYSLSKWLYAGFSVDGAIVTPRHALNRSYYGRAVSPADILIRRDVTSPHAGGLIAAINQVAGAR